MPVVYELIRKEADGTLSFGNYELTTKSKLDNFEYDGDLYKVKTYNEITKLERNGMFVYESVPGTTVSHFGFSSKGLEFTVEGTGSPQITLELEAEAEYKIIIDDVIAGMIKTNLSGKLVFSTDLGKGGEATVKIVGV